MRALLMSLLALSCSPWLDLERAQCATDGDCARFGSGVICDRAAAVCVPAKAEAPVTATPPSCSRTDKPLVRVEGDITANFRLTCQRNYLLVGLVFVKSGVTLAIDPGTTILGDKASKAALVVQPGARLEADGRRDQPIVFTSAEAAGQRAAGDWGGVIVLGRAPVNVAKPFVEGITEGGEYGGADEDDDSGVLRFVRIEYSGTKLGPNNEINGLTLAGVGRRTVVDFIQVRHTADDCFEFFGGTVNAKHLVCQWNGDDGFDWDNGYRGKLQFLLLQQHPTEADETNGFEGDNDALGTTNAPISEPTIYNATLCGKNRDVDKEQYGMLLRRSTKAHVFNTLVMGFEAGLDVRDPFTRTEIRHSLFAGNLLRNVAYEEDGSNPSFQKNDDDGFDELKYIQDPANRNGFIPPPLRDCFDPQTPGFAPSAPIVENAATPPRDGFFDDGATFVGAFRDVNDQWANGAWVTWSDR